MKTNILPGTYQQLFKKPGCEIPPKRDLFLFTGHNLIANPVCPLGNPKLNGFCYVPRKENKSDFRIKKVTLLAMEF